MPMMPRNSNCEMSTPANQPQARSWPSLTRAPIHITSITMLHTITTRPTTPKRVGDGVVVPEALVIKPATKETRNATTHAPMYHRVVMRFLICAPPGPRGPDSDFGNEAAGAPTCECEENGRGGRIRTLGPRFWRPML